MNAASTREIVTVQLGHYANHVGTHFWNMQESLLELPSRDLEDTGINTDCLYMSGRDAMGMETYTPRALIVDLKGSLRSLKLENDLFAPPPPRDLAAESSSTGSAEALWRGAVQEHRMAPHTQNRFLRDLNDTSGAQVDFEAQDYRLENEVAVWSDYNRPIYHPRTVYQVQEYSHNDSTAPFDDFQTGFDLAQTDLLTDELIDARLRILLEGCDHPQGLQVLADVDNGFGGLACGFLESFCADNPKTPIFTFGFSSQDRPQQQSRALRRYRTIGKTVAKMLEGVSTYVPMSTSAFKHRDDLGWSRHIRFNSELRYHTSALQALAIESCMRPISMRSESMTIFNLSSILTPYNSSIATISASLPLPVNLGANFRQLVQDSAPHKRNSYALNMMTRMNHGRLLGHRRLTQMCVFRGVKEGINLSACDGDHKFNRVRDEHLDGLLGGNWYTPATISYNIATPVSVRVPFPRIFKESVHFNGVVDEFATSAAPPTLVPTVSTLSTSTDIAIPLLDLRNRMSLHQNSQIVRERELDERDNEGNMAALDKLNEVIAEYEEIKTMST